MQKLNIYKLITYSAFLCLSIYSSAIENNSVVSPDNKLKADIGLTKDSKISYTVSVNGKPALLPSLLGIIMEDANFYNGLKLESVSDVEHILDLYTLFYGKKRNIEYKANKRTFHFVNSQGLKMDIIFHVSNDGVAFRYYFPGKSDKIYKIKEENTTFQFSHSTQAWIQPKAKSKSGWSNCNPSYEEHYYNGVVIDSLPNNDPGWVFPALFKTNTTWIAITETAPEQNYCGSNLSLIKGQSKFKIGFPEANEDYLKGAVYPESTLPWATPWRVITIGENLGTLVESTLGTDLAKPSAIQDYSFVKPGRSSWSWVLYKDDSTVYSVQKRFIDYASDMGWEYCLVDADWDQKIGYEKMGELCKYAASKKVGIIAWYNSAGDWNTTPYTPRNKMITKESRIAEFAKLKELGIKGIKVDFFGGDGQSMMAYYQNILADASHFGIMVNCHGSTLPRGLQRTYPNLVSMEAIKGFEFITFDQQNTDLEPVHCAVIPFTRNLFDPMDFTPVCFSEIPGKNRITTNAFELALAVLFLSGVQHYAEVPEGMAKVPDYVKDLMREIPVLWEDSRFVNGYPAKYVVIARKTNGHWYVAGINGENQDKSIEISLSFIDNKSGVLVTDGENKRSFTKQEVLLDNNHKLKLTLKGNGGFVIKF